jgi:hypothetical protein
MLVKMNCNCIRLDSGSYGDENEDGCLLGCCAV